MPRAKPPASRKKVYWWSSEIAELRGECVAARRQYTRQRRRRKSGGDATAEARLYGIYKKKKTSLQLTIKKAKTQIWEELLGTIDSDPWGRTA